MMMIFVTIIHVIVCLFLILVVLLQQGKSADWSGTFGGGSSQTAFGQRGSATLLSKATSVAAVLFMLLALTLSIMGQRGGSSVVSGTSAPPPSATTRPVTPAPAPATPAPAAPAASTPAPAPAAPAK